MNRHLSSPPEILKKEILEPAFRQYVDPFRIVKGKGFRLKDFDPGDTCGLTLDKADATQLLQRGTTWLAEVQDMLYAQDHRSLLLFFRRWMPRARTARSSTSCPASIRKAARSHRSSPSAEELDHDFLWRYGQVPARARAHRYFQPVLLRRGPRGQGA